MEWEFCRIDVLNDLSGQGLILDIFIDKTDVSGNYNNPFNILYKIVINKTRINKCLNVGKLQLVISRITYPKIHTFIIMDLINIKGIIAII